MTAEEELKGLDVTEHGLQSAYADFMPAASTLSFGQPMELPTAKVTGSKPVETAVPVERRKAAPVAGDGVKLTKIEMYCNPSHFDSLKGELEKIGITGMTVTNIMGCGAQRGATGTYRGVKMQMTLLPKIRVDVVVAKIPAGDGGQRGQESAVYRPYRRRQDLRLRCGGRGEGAHRRHRVTTLFRTKSDGTQRKSSP